MRHIPWHLIILSALAVFVIAGLSPKVALGAPDRCRAVADNTVSPPLNLAPMTLRILQSIIVPVAATDGLTHLAYAGQVTNLQPAAIEIVSVDPVDPLKGFAVTGQSKQLDVTGAPITGRVKLFNPPPADGSQTDPGQQYFSKVPGGGSGIMFFDVTYKNAGEIPRLLSHRITVKSTDTGVTTVGTTDPVQVTCAPPVTLRPPLVGHGWWDGNGCCALVNAHRSATLPINGDIRVPEQFAIDYVQVDAQGRCCAGPPRDLKSWPFFGAPILSAAAGKVVEVAIDEPEQVPGEPLVGVTVNNAAGNHIIEDIGDGKYILYAHLRRGSIPSSIKAGTLLQSGQQIGELGNTGSSTAPHLHFQVMDRPSALNATGLPFVFDTQTVEGHVRETAAEAEKTYESGRALSVETAKAEVRRLQMPAEGQVFGYNLQ
ncbi:MAG: Peptidase [Rhodospirillales bacterium]|nr:Peptidase [Rhodospirillales bacterium]